MRKHQLLISLFALALLAGACDNHASKEKRISKNNKEIQKIQLTDSMKNTLISRGDSITRHAQAAFQTALKKAIRTQGMDYAIGFCNIEAMHIADSVSNDQQVIIKRLAKKYRNPSNETNEVESEIYKTYILEWLNRETLQAKIFTNEEGHPVYYRPIGIQPVCLNCHGVPGNDIPPQLAEKIVQLYPEDHAIDFKNNELRGMWAITFPEFIIETEE